MAGVALPDAVSLLATDQGAGEVELAVATEVLSHIGGLRQGDDQVPEERWAQPLVEAPTCRDQADRPAASAVMITRTPSDIVRRRDSGVGTVRRSFTTRWAATPEEPLMTDVAAMIQAHPGPIDLDHALLAAAIEAALACSQTCTACADACLSEENVASMAKCVRTDLDCADLCAATARVLSRHTAYDPEIARATLQACITACRVCGDECGSHSDMHDHCRVCAQACGKCESACQALLDSIS